MKTRIVSVAQGKKAVAAAASALSNGGIVAYPTETSYALGCDATNAAAVKKMYSLKGRRKNKALPVIVDSLKTIKKYAALGGNENAALLCKKLMPGPLTLVVEMKKGSLPYNLSRDGIAFRISSHPFASALAGKLGKPIVSTSANRSGEPGIYSSMEIAEKYLGKVELIVDAGELKPTRASSIVDLRGERPLLVRQGGVSFRAVLQTLKKA